MSKMRNGASQAQQTLLERVRELEAENQRLRDLEADYTEKVLPFMALEQSS